MNNRRNMNTNRRNMNTNQIPTHLKTIPIIPTIPTHLIRPVFNFSDYVTDHTISKELIHFDLVLSIAT